MTWLAAAWLRIRVWLALAVAGVVALAGAWLAGRSKGKAVQAAATHEAQAEAQAAQDTIHTHEVRHAVEAEVQKLPDAPAQKVADADPATAAGRLRTDGWLRAPDDHEG